MHEMFVGCAGARPSATPLAVDRGRTRARFLERARAATKALPALRLRRIGVVGRRAMNDMIEQLLDLTRAQNWGAGLGFVRNAAGGSTDVAEPRGGATVDELGAGPVSRAADSSPPRRGRTCHNTPRGGRQPASYRFLLQPRPRTSLQHGDHGPAPESRSRPRGRRRGTSRSSSTTAGGSRPTCCRASSDPFPRRAVLERAGAAAWAWASSSLEARIVEAPRRDRSAVTSNVPGRAHRSS